MQMKKERGAIIVPVILHETEGWEREPWGNLNALPFHARAVTTWGDREAAWAEVQRGLCEIFESLRLSRKVSLLKQATTPVPSTPPPVALALGHPLPDTAQSDGGERVKSLPASTPEQGLPTPLSVRSTGGTPWLTKAITTGLLVAAVLLGGAISIRDHPTPLPPPPQQLPDQATQETPYVNSLGMKFVPVPISGDGGPPTVFFSIWETRVRDFASFVEESRSKKNGYDMNEGEPALTLESKGNADYEWKAAGGDWQNPHFAFKSGDPGVPSDHPVVCVSYNDAKAFCKWLTESEHRAGRLPEGWSYRLPTDHEWSCAVGLTEDPKLPTKDVANATEAIFPWNGTQHWGYPPSGNDGNYAGQESKVGPVGGVATWPTISGYADKFPRTAPVGSFRPNHYGIFDLGGNASEWCDTKYPVPGAFYSVRGSSWGNAGEPELRSSFRNKGLATNRNVSFGFRCIIAPDPLEVAELGDGTLGNPLPTPLAVTLPNGSRMLFCYCPPGTFKYGSPPSEQGRGSEQYVDQVIPKGFWMGQCEVTQEQWTAVKPATLGDLQKLADPKQEILASGPRFPMYFVDAAEAQDFVDSLGKSLPEGWKFALPTEVQWEYACRASTTTPFSFGTKLITGMANFDVTVPYGEEPGVAKPLNRMTMVASYPPNDWGLYDMHGNVSEWCRNPHEVIDHLPGSMRRGGAWDSTGTNCRSAAQAPVASTTHSNDTGFRVAIVREE